MNKAASWSIKGVGFDARQAAEQAARRAGLSVGEWMSQVISEQAAELGVDEDELGEDDRREAVTGRLARLSGRDDDQHRRWSRERRQDAAPASRRRREAMDDEFDRPRRRLRAAEAERLLGDAVEEFERRAAKTHGRTAAALASVADRLGDLEARLDEGVGQEGGEVRRSLDRLEQRMEALARRSAPPRAEPRPERDRQDRDHRMEASLREVSARLDGLAGRVEPARPADAAISAIESKLGAILEAVRQPAQADNGLSQPSRAALTAGLVHRPRAQRATLADAVAEIERRQRDLDVGEPRGRRAALFDREPARRAEPTAAALTPELVETRLDALAERLERVARDSVRKAAAEAAETVREAAQTAAESAAKAAAETAAKNARAVSDAADSLARSAAERAARSVAQAAAPVEPAMRGLQGEIARLADRVEEMRHEARRAAEHRPQHEIEALRQEMAGMARTLATLDPALSVGHLEQAVRDLARRVEHSRADGLSEAVVGPIARLADDLRAQIDKLDSRPALESVERAMSEMGARLEQASRSASSVDGAALAELKAESGYVRTLIEDAFVGAQPIARLERQIGALGDRLDRLSFAAPVVNPPEIAQAIGEIRAMMAAAVPAGSLDALEARVGALAESVEKLGEDRPPSAQLSQALGEIRNLVGAAAPAGAVQALERQVVGLAERLDRLVTAEPSAEPFADALGEIRSMMSRAAAAPQAGAQALERQIAALGERLDRLASERGSDVDGAVAEALRDMRAASGDARAAALSTLEGRLEDLSGKVEAVARAADVDKLADRVAARLSAVMAESAAPPVSSQQEETLRRLVAEISDRVGDVSRPALAESELAALRAEMKRLSDRVVRNEEDSPALVALTRSMSELVERLENMSETAMDAAERAARSALREAVDQGLVGSGREEIDALRQQQGEAERRAGATLGAVHDTLEKIVDRLAMLEDEVDAQAARAPAPPAFAASAAFASEPAPQARPASAASQTQHPLVAEEPGDVVLGRRAAPPVVAASLADDRLIEPSLGRGIQRDDDEAERRDAASFIAAARRMTQKSAEEAALRAVASETQAAPRSPVAKIASAARAALSRGEADAKVQVKPQKAAKAVKTPEKLVDIRDVGASPTEGKRAASGGSRRSILIGLIGLTLALGALLTVNKSLLGGGSSGVVPAPSVQVESGAASIPTPAPAPEPAPTPAAPDPQRSSALEPSATPGAMPLTPPASPATAQTASPDTTATGAIGASAQPALARGLQAAAEAGDAAAQYEMAARFAEGRGGVPRDLASAARWFEKAAAQGLAPAQFRLGALYEKGLGLPRDAAMARDWYLRAAQSGNARAMHNLAVLTADGAGGKPDYAGAAQWFLKASELGVRDSQYNLAILYARGLGIEQNLALSYTWFATAAKQGDEDAGRKRDEVAARLDAKLLEAAKKAADIFRPKTGDRAANEVQAPPGGWDKAGSAPAKAEGGKTLDRARPLARPKPV
jgi:localization factor PodJL